MLVLCLEAPGRCAQRLPPSEAPRQCARRTQPWRPTAWPESSVRPRRHKPCITGLGRHCASLGQCLLCPARRCPPLPLLLGGSVSVCGNWCGARQQTSSRPATASWRCCCPPCRSCCASAASPSGGQRAGFGATGDVGSGPIFLMDCLMRACPTWALSSPHASGGCRAAAGEGARLWRRGR